MEYLNYLKGDRYAIPMQERGLQSTIAKPFKELPHDKRANMDGMCFDRELNMYFVSIGEGTIYKMDMSSLDLELVYRNTDIRMTSLKIHKDGRLFVCCSGGGVDPDQNSDRIFAITPDGHNYEDIITGYSVGDMVFDADGGFYFTEFKGTAPVPSGKVYYVTPDFKTVHPVVENLARPDGISLSTDGKILWIIESLTGHIYRAELTGLQRVSRVYTIDGIYGPASCSVDIDDNLYVAVNGQGRILVLNKRGVPIGQILIDGREEGLNLWSTDIVVTPGTRLAYIIASGDNGNSRSGIFWAGAFAEGNTSAYQFQW